jgi:ubiquinone/menaquinone biosynthesis C-methylase UbiE
MTKQRSKGKSLAMRPELTDVSDETRKQEEAEFHDFIRGAELAKSPSEFAFYTSNRRFYSVARASTDHFHDWLRRNVAGKKVLDYGCGDGATSFFLAEAGAHSVGVDISPISVENCRREAAKRGLSDRCSFVVMDAENLTFNDSEFDFAVVLGVFHHLDFERSLQTLSRVLKPEGAIMGLEAFGHNPLFQLYRRRTPHLRTRWETEHILRRPDLATVAKHFRNLESRPFHLAVLAAVPFRNTIVFEPLRRILERVDTVLLRLPGIKWHAWMLWFVWSNPRKL